MAHKIVMNLDQSGTAQTDFSTLADQFLQSNSHLPPGGDQSWREQDAQRIFSGHDLDEDGINDAPVTGEDADPKGDKIDAFQEPGFPPLRPAAILLSLALATGVMFAVIMVSTPEILTAGFWSAPDSKSIAAPVPVEVADAGVTSAAPLVPVQAAVPAVDTLRPSLTDKAVPPVHEAAATTHREFRPAKMPVKISARAHGKTVAAKKVAAKKPAVRKSAIRAPTAKASAIKVAARAKRHGLPPIGEAYFASHAPAVPARKVATTDWKTEVAQWDERANEIRARNQALKNN